MASLESLAASVERVLAELRTMNSNQVAHSRVLDGQRHEMAGLTANLGMVVTEVRSLALRVSGIDERVTRLETARPPTDDGSRRTLPELHEFTEENSKHQRVVDESKWAEMSRDAKKWRNLSRRGGGVFWHVVQGVALVVTLAAGYVLVDAARHQGPQHAEHAP